eukprot:1973420-Pyramimonas_sp.AAC.1
MQTSNVPGGFIAPARQRQEAPEGLNQAWLGRVQRTHRDSPGRAPTLLLQHPPVAPPLAEGTRRPARL